MYTYFISLNLIKSIYQVVMYWSASQDLDELQSLDLFQNFLLEGYRGSFSELNGKLTSESEKLNLLRQVEHYYQRERLYMLRYMYV